MHYLEFKYPDGLMEKFEIQSLTSTTSTQPANDVCTTQAVCTRHANLMQLFFEEDRFCFPGASSLCAVWVIGLFRKMCSPFESESAIQRKEVLRFSDMPIGALAPSFPHWCCY
jgi:hypothetical protein